MTCYVMVYEKDGVKKFNSIPLEGVKTVEEAQSRAYALYTLQKDGNGLKLGNILAVYGYTKCDGPVIGTFTDTDFKENGFVNVKEIKTYAQWAANSSSAVGGAKKKTLVKALPKPKPQPKPKPKSKPAAKKTK